MRGRTSCDSQPRSGSSARRCPTYSAGIRFVTGTLQAKLVDYPIRVGRMRTELGERARLKSGAIPTRPIEHLDRKSARPNLKLSQISRLEVLKSNPTQTVPTRRPRRLSPTNRLPPRNNSNSE